MPFFPPMPDHFLAKGKARKGPMVPGSFLVAWQGTDGAWRSFGGKQIGSLRWYAITLSLMMLIFAALLAPAIFIARRITGPIHRLAEGVAKAGVERADLLPVEGPPEVQRLGLASTACGPCWSGMSPNARRCWWRSRMTCARR